MKKQNKLEDSLKKQLGDLEYKPSDSLWENIEKNIGHDKFEADLRKRLDGFTVQPKNTTWESIEKNLGRKGTSHQKFIYYSAFLLLFTAGILMGLWLKLPGTEDKVIASTESQPVKNGLAGSHSSLSAAEIKPEIRRPATEAKNKLAPMFIPSGIVEGNLASGNIGKGTASGKTAPARNLRVTPVEEISTPVQPVGSTNPEMSDPSALPVVISQASGTLAPAPKGQPPVEQAIAAEPTPANGINTENINTRNTVDQSASTPALNSGENAGSVIINPPVNTPEENSGTKESIVENTVPVAPVAVAADSTRPAETPATEPKTAAPPDSATKPQQPANTADYNFSTNEAFSNLSLTAFAGFNMSFIRLELPSKSHLDYGRNIALRRQVEKPAAEFTGSFLLNYHINNRWSISSGFVLTNFRQVMQYNVVNTDEAKYRILEPTAKYININDSITNGNAKELEIRYSFTEIPLFVTFRILEKKKISLEVQGGLSLGIITGVSSYFIDPSNVGLMVMNEKNDYPPLKNVLFMSLMPAISYQLNPSVNIGIMPSIKVSLTSMMQNEYVVQQYPYFAGINAFLRKRF